MPLPINPVSVIGAPSICCMPDMAVTTTPTALPAANHGVDPGGVEEIMLQNDPGSASTVLIGDSVNQTLRIIAGASIVLPCRNPTQLFAVIGAGSATLHIFYRGEPR